MFKSKFFVASNYELLQRRFEETVFTNNNLKYSVSIYNKLLQKLMFVYRDINYTKYKLDEVVGEYRYSSSYSYIGSVDSEKDQSLPISYQITPVNFTKMWYTGSFEVDGKNVKPEQFLEFLILEGNLSKVTGNFAGLVCHHDKLFMFRTPGSPFYVDFQLNLSTEQFTIPKADGGKSFLIGSNKIFRINLNSNTTMITSTFK